MTMVVRLPRSLDGDKVLGERIKPGKPVMGHRAQGTGHWALGIGHRFPMRHAPCAMPYSHKCPKLVASFVIVKEVM